MHLTDLLATLPPELRDYVRGLEARASALEVHASALEVHASALELHTATLEMQAITLQARNQFLEEQFRLAQLKRFAPSSEKFGAQGCLFNEAEQDVVTPAPEVSADADTKTRVPGNKRGRKPLPAHLPRKRVEHDVPESEKVCACCQGNLHRMGEEISEQLNIFRRRSRYCNIYVSSTVAATVTATVNRARSLPARCRPSPCRAVSPVHRRWPRY